MRCSWDPTPSLSIELSYVTASSPADVSDRRPELCMMAGLPHSGLGLCRRLSETLPPEFAAPSAPSQASVAYVVTAVVPPGLTEPSQFLITCDEVGVFAAAVDEEVFWWLRWDIDQAVARRCAQLL